MGHARSSRYGDIGRRRREIPHITSDDDDADIEGGVVQDTLTELDNADIRLNGTLELLRNSAVDPAFGSATGEKDAAVRTLHDFVEDEGIENLRSKLRHSIDEVQVRFSPLPCLGIRWC